MTQILALVGAGLTVALGMLGLVRPEVAADLVGVVPEGSLGRSEIRATYGGLFLGLGGACLWLRSPEAYLVVALAWLSAAAARLVAIAIERNVSKENAVGVVVEAGIGGLLMAGAVSVVGV